MKQTLRIVLGAFLVTTALIKAGPVLAEASAPAINVSIVRTVDLDLSTEAGRRQLEHRFANAAREVCGTASDVDLAGKNAIRHCRHDVLARAQAQLDVLLAGQPIAVTATR
jgi:UrcA family protein